MWLKDHLSDQILRFIFVDRGCKTFQSEVEGGLKLHVYGRAIDQLIFEEIAWLFSLIVNKLRNQKETTRTPCWRAQSPVLL